MNTSNTSNQFDPTALLVFVFAAGIMVMKFWLPLVEFLSALIGLLLIGLYAAGAVYLLRRRVPRETVSETEWDLDKLDEEEEETENPHEAYSAQWHSWRTQREREIAAKNKKDEPAPVFSWEPPQRHVRIDSERLLESAAHWENDLNEDEIRFLSKKDYERHKFVPFSAVQAIPCWIKKNSIESLEHTFVVHMIANHLRLYVNKVQISLTKLPDIIFEHKGKPYAIEVETPLGLPYKHKRLALKAKENNDAYDKRWVIVVTKSAYAKCFKRYTKVLRRNQIDDWIDHLFQGEILSEQRRPPE